MRAGTAWRQSQAAGYIPDSSCETLLDTDIVNPSVSVIHKSLPSLLSPTIIKDTLVLIKFIRILSD